MLKLTCITTANRSIFHERFFVKANHELCFIKGSVGKNKWFLKILINGKLNHYDIRECKFTDGETRLINLWLEELALKYL
jgi:hypothetical protein